MECNLDLKVLTTSMTAAQDFENSIIKISFLNNFVASYLLASIITQEIVKEVHLKTTATIETVLALITQIAAMDHFKQSFKPFKIVMDFPSYTYYLM